MLDIIIVLAARIPGCLRVTLTFLLVTIRMVTGPIVLCGVELVEWILIVLLDRRRVNVVVTRDWFVPRMYMNRTDGCLIMPVFRGCRCLGR